MHLEVTAHRERRIQDARFPMLKTLDAFSFEAQPDLDRDTVLQVFDCRFVAEAARLPNPNYVIQAIDAVTGNLRREYRRDLAR